MRSSWLPGCTGNPATRQLSKKSKYMWLSSSPPPRESSPLLKAETWLAKLVTKKSAQRRHILGDFLIFFEKTSKRRIICVLGLLKNAAGWLSTTAHTPLSQQCKCNVTKNTITKANRHLMYICWSQRWCKTKAKRGKQIHFYPQWFCRLFKKIGGGL